MRKEQHLPLLLVVQNKCATGQMHRVRCREREREREFHGANKKGCASVHATCRLNTLVHMHVQHVFSENDILNQTICTNNMDMKDFFGLSGKELI
jgi:hypothetical protein